MRGAPEAQGRQGRQQTDDNQKSGEQRLKPLEEDELPIGTGIHESPMDAIEGRQ